MFFFQLDVLYILQLVLEFGVSNLRVKRENENELYWQGIFTHTRKLL